MRDIWAFLMQTLTASGAAVLLLILKAIFRDKLSPRWQFGIWGLLGLVLLFPAGLSGRYTLLNWPLWLETAKTLLTGQHTLTRVIAPIPLPSALPRTVGDWLFWIYLAGVAVTLLWHLVSYLRLRAVLQGGTPVNDGTAQQIRAVAERYSLPLCRAIQVPGLSSAFLCGVFKPVLVLPAGTEVDDKVLLHELLHLKHRDVVWSVVICLLRCIHWCNPLLWYCADRAGNDLEARCDQRVLERLEGEERREYGHILLSMANEKYAHTAGTTSVANGGTNIRRRIEAIARFKLYPAGMALVSVCMAVLLVIPLVVGTRAGTLRVYGRTSPDEAQLALSMASARTTFCTTPAGALDTYGKSLLEHNGIYRAMCAPLSMQEEIFAAMAERSENSNFPYWQGGLDTRPKNTNSGYYIYDFRTAGDGYEAMIAMEVAYPPDGNYDPEAKVSYLAYQTVRVEREGPRWVVMPVEEITVIEVRPDFIYWAGRSVPCRVYSAETDNFRVDVQFLTCFEIDNTVEVTNDFSWAFGSTTYFDTVPKPNAEFSKVRYKEDVYVTWIGSDEDKEAVQSLGISTSLASDEEERPFLRGPGSGNSSGSSSDGTSWASRYLGPDWESVQTMIGSGSDLPFDYDSSILPDYYAADLYVNGQRVAELELRPEEGVIR